MSSYENSVIAAHETVELAGDVFRFSGGESEAIGYVTKKTIELAACGMTLMEALDTLHGIFSVMGRVKGYRRQLEDERCAEIEREHRRNLEEYERRMAEETKAREAKAAAIDREIGAMMPDAGQRRVFAVRLVDAGLCSLSQAKTLSDDELLSMRGIGRSTIATIRNLEEMADER